MTLLLIAANVVAFLFELSLDARGQNLLVLTGGAIPYEIVNWVDIGPRNLLPLPGSIFTSMFLHGGWMHLIGNMWFLWIFGDNVEERLGTVRFVIFYLVVGIVGALAQCYSMPSSTAPMIGASGAVAGALGGYVMLFPRAKVVTFVGIPFLWHIRDVPAWIFLGIWFLGQFFIPGIGRGLDGARGRLPGGSGRGAAAGADAPAPARAGGRISASPAPPRRFGLDTDGPPRKIANRFGRLSSAG